MKITIEVDCTPKEARNFLGFPDLDPIHNMMQDQFKDWMEKGAMAPEALMRAWMPMGAQGFDQFQKFMTETMKQAAGGRPAPKDDKSK